MTTLLDRPRCTEILDNTCHALADGDVRPEQFSDENRHVSYLRVIKR